MSIQVALNHWTRYRYEKAVSVGPQVIRLRPAPHCRTPIPSYSLSVTPAGHFLNWQFDLQNNHLARVLFPEKTNEFVVEVCLVAELSPFNPFDFLLEPGVEDYPFEYAPELAKDLEPYRSVEPAGPLLQTFIGKPPRETRGTIGFLVDLNRRVRNEIEYVIRLDPGVQTCEQTLEKCTGSCRDSAWLLVQILRHLGIAARFVSGYLIQLAAEESATEAPSGPRTDSADFHAWAEVFLPGAGWIGMDPTSGLFAGEGHIPLVCTPNASKAAPIEGTVELANVDFSHSMSIRRLNDAPRPSKPFTEEDWLQVEQVAHHVDADLEAQDVRRTMGGEPTFVGIDEPESPQWNIDALGPIKRTRGLSLIRCLREKLAPGALLHFGQGKWYPGEPLPRWALGCYWRKDGVPIWEDPTLIADDNKDYKYNAADARRFLEALTRRLDVDDSFIMTALEDVFYYLWKERRLPVNVDPLDSKLEDPIDRAGLARVFEEGLGKTVGYVLPLRRIPTSSGVPHWSSQPWFLASQRLFLVPGDSPIGYRLPLESLPWTKPEDAEWSFDPDPFQQRDRLPEKPARKRQAFTGQRPAPKPGPRKSNTTTAKPPEKGTSSPWVSRPALCVQARA